VLAASYTWIRAGGVALILGGIAVVLSSRITTPANFRLLNDLVQNALVLAAVLLAFLPTKQALLRAVALGVFVMVFDFVLETVAVRLGWWRPLGGTQFPPVLVVPLEMLIGFLIMGTSFGVVLCFPVRIRNARSQALNWARPWFENPRRDRAWQLLLILLVAAAGTHGDYAAGPEIWLPGAHWRPAYTFCVWAGTGLAVLWAYRRLQRTAETGRGTGLA